MRRSFVLLVALSTLPLSARAFDYPESRRTDQVDSYHGVDVPDPYRWLEADVRESPEVEAWVEAQNDLTLSYLASLPRRDAIYERVQELYDYDKYSTPTLHGGRYYFFSKTGLQNQWVLYRLDTLDGEARELIDPNGWSEDGTVALAGTSFSDDGEYVAYGVQESGSDWRTWRVLETQTGHLLDDEIRWVKWSEPEWTPGGTGFYYARYDAPEEGEAFLAANRNQRLYFHRLGTPQESDELVYERPDEPDWGFGATVTEDGRYLIVSIWRASIARNRMMYRDLGSPDSPWVELVTDFDHEYSLVSTEGSTFYCRTELDAPLRRVIGIDVASSNPTWHEVIPESGDAIRAASRVGDFFLVSYLHDAKSRVAQFDLAGKLVREISLPGIGSVRGFQGRRGDRDTFYSFSGFTSPSTQYRLDLATGKSEMFRRDEVAFDPDEYVSRQVFCESADGTRFPMFLAHRKDVQPDGERSVLLYGYGGFNQSMMPSFSVSRLAWMEMGGVFALANLRGGGEYGEAWHQAGMKLQKQNTFDDFIAAAEWLVDNGYSKPEKIGIQGGSNGGLLVGACMAQRPDLFGCALPAVGVMDMLRYTEFTGGRFWVPDYGDPQVPEEFAALYAYSPYHNLKEGVAYPATLVTTADTDDRVVPGHSFKFAAALQHAQGGPAPVLIRIETRAGHGGGKPTDKALHEVADTWAFLAEHTGLSWTPALRTEASQ